MTEFIIIAIIDAIFTAVLAFVFIKEAVTAKKEGRIVRFGFATLFAIISIGATLCALLGGLFSSVYLVGAPLIVSVMTVPLSWMAMAYLKGDKRTAMFFLPSIPLTMSFLVIMNASLGGDMPLKESEVDYTSQSEIEELLGVGELPKLKFNEAADGSAGTKVWMLLENPADSSQLCKVYDLLKQKHPLQCTEDYKGRMYYMANNNNASFVNVNFGDDGILVLYGGIWTIDANNDHCFDSINAPMPKYEYVTYFASQCGPDGYHEQRIRFDSSISQAWLKQIESTANQDSTWIYEEDEELIYIEFNNSRLFIRMKIHKNLDGERKIADVEWGDY